jgi:DNA invertase Pin-like site-specific DNA recombinase
MIKAAQYVRMSTDMQKYSTENQSTVIAAYAAERGIEIVRSYSDSGKSGLGIKGRPGLQSLLSDVRLGLANFSVILVYDV